MNIFIKILKYFYYYTAFFLYKIKLFYNKKENEKLMESFLDIDKKYIDPLKTRFSKTFENTIIEYNSNIEPIFYKKKDFLTALQEVDNKYEPIWKTRILFESTPRGNIILFYDAYKLGFSFYCDQKTISYDILNAAAMKYVMLYRCRDFFIDESYVPKQFISPLIDIHYKEEKK